MHVLVIEDRKYVCLNGFVSRCVSAVDAVNHEDARRVCEILNENARASSGLYKQEVGRVKRCTSS